MAELSTNLVLNMNEAKEAIRGSLAIRQPLMFWGPPGIGKSDVTAQVAKEAGRELIDIRLPNWEPTDMKGIPFYNPTSNVMEWGPPSELPMDPDSTAIVFLDEINGADENVQGAAYQLILNRRIGTYVLPDGVDIVAAGNRDGDRGVTFRMPSPLANRFIHIEAKADFEAWKSWAIRNSINADIIGYLENNKQDLFDFNPQVASRAFATPRTWSFVSKIVSNVSLSPETIKHLVAGSIGDGMAIKFSAYRNLTVALPKATDVLDGKAKNLEDSTQISAMYSLSASLCYELRTKFQEKDKRFNKMLDNFMRYIMDNFTTEIVVLTVRSAITDYGITMNPTEMDTFDEFQEKYGHHVFSALGIK